MTLVEFLTWDDVLKHARSEATLFYHAPMDRSARSVRVMRVSKDGRIRIDPMSNDADPFWADSAHLTRFRKKK
jgi:hypothetical protein